MRKILLFVISVAMVVAGLLMLAFGLLAGGPGMEWFVAGGPMLVLNGPILTYECILAASLD